MMMSGRSFYSHARKVIGLYQALLPHPDANEFTPIRVLMGILLDMLNEVEPHNITDISEVRQSVEVILDKSVKTAGYVIDEVEGRSIDLSKLDFEALRKKFIAGRKHIEAEKIKRLISGKLGRMVSRNRLRTDYLEKFQRMIDDYNDGRTGIDLLFDNLVIFAKELGEEERRCISENLSEEELAIFDLLYNPDLTDQEKDQVKNAARRLLRVLKYEKFVLDWRKRQQTRAQVMNTIMVVLDQELPPSYTKQAYDQKCEEIYQHVYDSYYDSGQSVYN